MPRKPCYWTRKLELELVEFVKRREFIWKPVGNTNHHIQRKYKAYAEFATIIGGGFTARAVRDRWVNIRSTFHHNLRRVDRSKEKATSAEDIYVPCWPLWQSLQFLREVPKREPELTDNGEHNYEDEKYKSTVKDRIKIDFLKQEAEDYEEEDSSILELRQRSGPRPKSQKTKKRNSKCTRILNDLVKAMKPVSNGTSPEQPYWFFGKHVTERLNMMSYENAESASREIVKLLDEWPQQVMDVT